MRKTQQDKPAAPKTSRKDKPLFIKEITDEQEK